MSEQQADRSTHQRSADENVSWTTDDSQPKQGFSNRHDILFYTAIGILTLIVSAILVSLLGEHF